MVPSSVVLVDEALPLNERGKVDRDSPAGARRGAASAAPDDPRTGRSRRLMAEVLQLDSVGPDENFFALGGSSLLAIQLVGRLRDRLGIEADIGAVFEAPTAARARASCSSGPACRRPRCRRCGRAPRAPVAPLTAAQRRAWLFGRLHPDSIAYQFAVDLPVRGRLDEGALRGALAELLTRHEILRTSFEERDGEPVQVVHDRVPAPLEAIDLRGEGIGAWPRLVRERVRTRIDPGAAPLVRWTLAAARRATRGRWSRSSTT